MEKRNHTEQNNLSTLAEDARALLGAPADVATDKVVEARNRLATALENGKELIGRARETAVEQARAADDMIRDRPYQMAAIALGVGALIGYLATRSCKREA